jgi:Zn-dependent protease with chaperone function
MILHGLLRLGLNNFGGYLLLKLVYLLLAFLVLVAVRRAVTGKDKEWRYQMIFRYVNILLLIGFLALEIQWPLWVWLQLQMNLIPALLMTDLINLLLLSGYLVFFLYQSFLLTRKIRVLHAGFGSYVLQNSYIWLSVLNLIIFLRIDYFYLTLIPGNLPWYRQVLIESAVTGAFIIVQWLVLSIRRLRMMEAGPELRKLVAEVAGRFRMKVGVVRIWRLDGVKNAFAGGLWVRSIFLTETLVNSASRDDLRMIIGHECVHLKKHHLWIRVGLVIGLVWLGSLFIEDLAEWSWVIGFIYALAAVLIYQSISRYQELQADLLAAKLVGNNEAMADALLRTFGNGFQRFNRFFRLLAGHPELAERISRLRKSSESGIGKNEEH